MDKVDAIAKLLSENLPSILAITIPLVLFVSAVIIGAYQKFVLPSLTESKNSLTEAKNLLSEVNKQLESKATDAIRERDLEREGRETDRQSHMKAVDELGAQIAQLMDSKNQLVAQLEKSTTSERRLEHRVEQLLIEQTQFRVTGKGEVPLSSFFVETLAGIEGGQVLFDGKLILPPLNALWTQVAGGKAHTETFRGGDMGLWQRLASISFRTIEKVHKNTLAFNIERPPYIWTTTEFANPTNVSSVFPYIQVSLISRDDADKLMKAVRADIDSIVPNLTADLQSVLVKHGVATARGKVPTFSGKQDNTVSFGGDKIWREQWGPALSLILTEIIDSLKSDPVFVVDRFVEAILQDNLSGLSAYDEMKVRRIADCVADTLGTISISELADAIIGEYKENKVSIHLLFIRSVVFNDHFNLANDARVRLRKLVGQIESEVDAVTKERIARALTLAWENNAAVIVATFVRSLIARASRESSLDENDNEIVQGLLNNFDAFLLSVEDRLKSSVSAQRNFNVIAKECGELIAAYAEGPMSLIRNCVLNLGRVPPETGLLVGRMLYYVFGASKGAKVDIQQLTCSYEGSYARVRTEVGEQSEGAGLVTFDYILILATKSDFCLVHSHIPQLSKEMFTLDIEMQNWIKNVRMAQLR